MVRIIPLGGLGEIGLNSMVVEAGGERLLIDCGLLFPSAELHGVGVIYPDLGYLLSEPHRLGGVVLTHGHEDHVGALPSLLRHTSVPVYGTAFTLALVRHRLEEMGIEGDLREIAPRHPFKVGQAFTVEPFRVVHSMPDAIGLAIRTPEGILIHTGDFKLDETPLDGLPTDLERLGELGDEGVLCLLSDSTNSEYPTPTQSERVVAETFERLFAQAQGRLVVSMFASNVHRIRHTLELCERLGRKVVLSGRSLVRNVDLARQVGALNLRSDLIIPVEDSYGLHPSKVAILATGAQAEERSALVRMAQPPGAGDGDLRVRKGDTVVLSSRAIPGNERQIAVLLDQLHERGAHVVYGGSTPGVHVSGHASAPQQAQVLRTVRPRHFIPIHGEVRHLHTHLELARECGVAEERSFLTRDGEVIAFEDGQGGRAGSVPIGQVYMDRWGEGEVLPEAIAERNKLAELGVIAAVVVIDGSRGGIVSGPHLTGRGLSRDEEAHLPAAAGRVGDMLSEISPALFGDVAFVREQLTRAVRRVFKEQTGKRPGVLPLVVKL